MFDVNNIIMNLSSRVTKMEHDDLLPEIRNRIKKKAKETSVFTNNWRRAFFECNGCDEKCLVGCDWEISVQNPRSPDICLYPKENRNPNFKLTRNNDRKPTIECKECAGNCTVKQKSMVFPKGFYGCIYANDGRKGDWILLDEMKNQDESS